MTKHAKMNSGMMTADETDPADSTIKSSLTQHKKSGYGVEALKENTKDKVE